MAECYRKFIHAARCVLIACLTPALLAAQAARKGNWAVDSVTASAGAPLADSGDAIGGLYRNVGRYIDESYRELDAAAPCFTPYSLPGKEHSTLRRPNARGSKVRDRTLGVRSSREVVDVPCQPQVTAARDAAFLFMYRAKPDMDAAFAEGYKRHLEWHAAHSDSLTWLAWTVIDGPSTGTFVDGTFGISFKAFDDRVDQAADGQDATKNVTAFAVPTNRAVLRLRPELSTSTRLEHGLPGRMQKVTTFVAQPGRESMVVQTLRTMAAAKYAGLDYSIYERTSGGEQPAFIVVVQLDAWADLADASKDPAERIRRATGSSLVRSETEIWAYRPDLTYSPSTRGTEKEF